MENSVGHIFLKTFYMKKTLTMLALLLASGSWQANAQSEKELPPPPPPPPPPAVNMTAPDLPPYSSLDKFYKTNPSVDKLQSLDNKIVIKLKNGKKEEYNLRNETEKNNFLQKYKLIPAPPPPPPPPTKKIS